MCGIIGYIGKNEALPLLMAGLKTLEYRGYDSAGIALHSEGVIKLKRSVGQVENLEKAINPAKFSGHLGIAHTRWATHGIPSQANAHPHYDCQERIFIAHNGIIENYKELKGYLLARGHVFTSETDTEAVAHLIEDFAKKEANFATAFWSALKMITGAYALAVIDKQSPHTLYAAKFSSPLVIGVGKQENFLASDPSALVSNTKDVIYLQDHQIAKITKDTINITNLSKQSVTPTITHLIWDLEKARKGKYPHFMLKEIFEGPETVASAFLGRLNTKTYSVKLGGLEKVRGQLQKAKRIIILACGTSYYAGLIGEYLFEELAGIPTEVHFASEFRYRQQPFDRGTVALVISQSGETADTLAALQKAKEHNLLTLGIVNVVGATIARQTDAGVYNHAGPEIGVASTKAFLSQVTILALMASYLSGNKNTTLLRELKKIPEKISHILSQTSLIERLAEKYRQYENFIFLGRRYSYPTALEGALKLKEISYVHAEGYGAGEMKHGPIALISQQFPSIALVPQNSVCEKMYSNLAEIRARKGPVLAIATMGDKKIASLADDVFYIPKTLEPFESLLSVVPLQLFAYYMGTKLGHNVDKPRNLAKSVTVE